MKITSRASDYALLLLIRLAKHQNSEPLSIKKICEELNLSVRFLANIANKLTTHRIIVSTRGIHGGIRLARTSDQISVKEIIEAVEGPVQTMFCQNTHEDCHHLSLCQMKPFWDDIQNMVTNKLTTTTLADLIIRPQERPAAFSAV